jgi:CO/xanthine dehydrogenase Mo-binding subunit
MVATEPRQLRVVGTRPVRPDGTDKVTGRAQYGADIRLPGMLYGRVKRSPHAHALIKRIDASRALALSGVKGVLTYDDLPVIPGADAAVDIGEGAARTRWLTRNLLARDKVLYQGHAVAAVCATDPHIAEDALGLIDVEYEVLPPVLTAREAMDESAPLLHPDLMTDEVAGVPSSGRPSNIASHIQYQAGDLDAGFASADIIVEHEFETGTYHQGYIEPQNGTAYWNEDGEVTVWVSTQGPFVVRAQMALVLQIPVSKVRVVATEIGGGFGGKIPVYMEPFAALFSRRTGKPVKMSMSREEVLQATGPTSATWIRAKLGARRDGTLVAADVRLAFEAGAFPGSPVGGGARCALGPYDVPNFHVEGWDVVVNKPKTSAYRAPGSPMGAFAVESLVDEIAEQLEMDPMDLRLQNAARQGSRATDGALRGVIGNVDVMEAIKNSPHYRSELQGDHRGRGVAMGYWHNAGLESSAYATVHADGVVSLVVGSTDLCGTRAALAMQFAEAMGIPYEDVHPHIVDTDSIGYTAVTGGSRSAFSGGWAVYETALDIQRQMAARAAGIWETTPDQVRYADGVFSGPDAKRLTFKELAGELPHTGGMIQGRADVNPTGIGAAYAGHICDVEVDPETGKVTILRYTAVQDVGKAVHPSYVENQLQGGASQGIGMALTEEYWYDDDGVLRNASLLDYRMPTTLDLPMMETILVEVANPGHPYGVRGVGEVPIVPPLAAVANAIYHATGARVQRLPASPRVLLEELLPPEA